MSDENVPLSRPVMNTVLILANVVVFLVGVTMPGLLYPGAKSYDDVIEALGMTPYYVVHGERLYTLVTSLFLHADIMHLLGNMLFLYIFGDNVEAVMGKARYLAFYLSSGLIAHVFHIASISLMPSHALITSYSYTPWLVPAIGASGAISGVLGAYLILYPSAMVRMVWFWGFIPLFYRLPASIYLIVWFIYQLVMGLISLGGISTGIAFWAHIGGFLAGIALVPVFVDRRLLERYRRMLRRGWGYWYIRYEY